jgi:hypothetical protein
MTIQPSPARRIVAIGAYGLGSSSATVLAPLLPLLAVAFQKLELGIPLNVVDLIMGFCLLAGFYFVCSLPLNLLAGVVFVALDRRGRRRYLLALFTTSLPIALIGAMAWQGVTQTPEFSGEPPGPLPSLSILVLQWDICLVLTSPLGAYFALRLVDWIEKKMPA